MKRGTPHTSERLFPNGRVIELIGNPMPGGGFVMSFTDITEFREAEKALKAANEGLEQRVAERTHELSQLNTALTEAKAHAEAANASKTRFLAAVSHDLMQPLNAARLFSAALAHQDGLASEATSLVNQLDSALRSSEDLITDLLDISRLESGRINPDKSVFPIATLLETLGSEFTALAHEQGVDFRVRTSGLHVHSDIRMLRRVLQNFLTNAFRYAKGKVLLGIRREGTLLRLEVWDRGPGIPENKRQEIFEEFKRLDSHQTRAEKGLGLGLAIADGLCRLLEHRLEVRSWVGRGSVFSVSVPMASAAAVAPRPIVSTAADLTLSGVRVLCVDNEENILAGMQSLLSRWGCVVSTARSRTECEQLLASGPLPVLILADYHLDQGDTGPALVEWIRTHHEVTLPAVVISADGRPELIAQVRSAGCDYLPKPVKPAALRALISRYVVRY
jgi:signal transduction histidine kinase